MAREGRNGLGLFAEGATSLIRPKRRSAKVGSFRLQNRNVMWQWPVKASEMHAADLRVVANVEHDSNDHRTPSSHDDALTLKPANGA